MGKKFRKYTTGRYDIFQGRGSTLWYIYDTVDKRYVGGVHTTKASAEAWVMNS